jgi:hypothetical protein
MGDCRGPSGSGRPVGGFRSRLLNAREFDTIVVGNTKIKSLAIKEGPAALPWVLELDADGRIKQWREAYDLTSVTDQIEAAGFNVPE